MADRNKRLRLRRRRVRIVIALAVVLVAAGGGVAWAMSGPSGPRFRTATATVTSVTQVLDSVGTLGAVNKSSVRFPVSGRVASVSAVVGQAVTAGAVLATLDTSALDQAISQANQTVASDQEKLANDETSQSSTASSASTDSSASADSLDATPLTAAPPSSSPSAPSGSHGSGSSSGHSGSPSAAVAAAQQTLTRDQKALDAILSAGSLADLQALVATSGPCALGPAPTTTVAATSDASGTITVTTQGAASITAQGATVGQPQQTGTSDVYTITGSANTAYTVMITPSAGVIDASTCTAAIQTLVTTLAPDPNDSAWALAQAITTDELTLSNAITALEKSAASTSGSSGSRGTGTSSSSTASRSTSSLGQSSGSQSSRSGGSSVGTSSGPASPEQLVADQAAIDAANAELAVAQQNRDQATIRSPISGTVAAVGLTAGASAGSNTVTVIGPGADEVSTTVSLTNLDLVKTGESASVTVDGVSGPITGQVTSVGVLNTTTGSTTAFPVTVLLAPTAARLFDGAGADVAITVGSVNNVLTVPSSAVHSVGTIHTVSVLAGGKSTLAVVGIGAVGIDRTQITSGLKAGQRVILAQLNTPLPSSGTTTGRGLAGTGLTGGGLGGGGLGGGGLTGARTRTGG